MPTFKVNAKRVRKLRKAIMIDGKEASQKKIADLSAVRAELEQFKNETLNPTFMRFSASCAFGLNADCSCSFHQRPLVPKRMLTSPCLDVRFADLAAVRSGCANVYL